MVGIEVAWILHWCGYGLAVLMTVRLGCAALGIVNEAGNELVAPGCALR